MAVSTLVPVSCLLSHGAGLSALHAPLTPLAVLPGPGPVPLLPQSLRCGGKARKTQESPFVEVILSLMKVRGPERQ